MSSPDSKLVPGHRAVPMVYYEKQIRELICKVTALENKVDRMQELIDQYEWAIGIGE